MDNNVGGDGVGDGGDGFGGGSDGGGVKPVVTVAEKNRPHIVNIDANVHIFIVYSMSRKVGHTFQLVLVLTEPSSPSRTIHPSIHPSIKERKPQLYDDRVHLLLANSRRNAGIEIMMDVVAFEDALFFIQNKPCIVGIE
jgi:hypothetical protein